MIFTGEDFETMVMRAVHYDKHEHDTSKNWGILKELYNKNYVQATDFTERIPRKIHQIWLGGELRPKFRGYVDTWQRLHPTWEYKMWTDKDVDSISIERRDVFDNATNLGQKSDILRYEILRQQGGIYVDTDFECLKPLDDLLFLEFFTGITTDKDAQLYIGILGSVPDHPIMKTCATNLEPYSGNDGDGVMGATGPYYFTRCFFATVNENMKGVVPFPMAFFYPFPNHLRFTEDAHKYILPCSYAIHHWKTSWLYP